MAEDTRTQPCFHKGVPCEFPGAEGTLGAPAWAQPDPSLNSGPACEPRGPRANDAAFRCLSALICKTGCLWVFAMDPGDGAFQ